MGKENHSISDKYNKPLLVALNKFGEIIQFNKECQRLTNYSRNDVIYRNIMDFLIPTSHLNKWKEMVDLTLKNGEIDNFIIPWKTSKGKEILISWSSNVISDRKSKNGDISYVGKIVDSDYEKSLEETDENIYEDINEELFFKEFNEKKYADKKGKKTSKSKTKKYNKFFKNKEEIDNLENNTTKKPKNFEKAFEDLSKKYEKLYIKITELENNEKEIEQRLNKIDDDLQNKKVINKYDKESIIEFTDVDNKNKSDEYHDTLTDKFETTDDQINFLSSDYDINKKQEELARFEAKLIEDKKNLDKRVFELSQWKEKLLELESEIEKRRSDLVAQESEFLQNLATTSDSPINQENKYLANATEQISGHNDEQKTLHEIFDKIPDCAVIIQRGTLKKVNQSFAELLGYNINEMVDKSLFDFISPEGFSVIEKYYLDRLKGVKSSGYGIILLTKDNIEMPVEVSTQPTIFKGDKAEIAIFSTKEQSQNEPDKDDEYIDSSISDEENISNNNTVENTEDKSSSEKQLFDEDTKENQNENNTENEEIINNNSKEEKILSEDEENKPNKDSESDSNQKSEE